MKLTRSQIQEIILEEYGSRLDEACGCQDMDHSKHGEGSMARNQLARTMHLSKMLAEMIHEDDNLEEWVESKITKAHDYLTTVLGYLVGEKVKKTLPMGMHQQELEEKIKKNRKGRGYFATSKSGNPLSKKPKSRKAALKQIAAVEISKAERKKKKG